MGRGRDKGRRQGPKSGMSPVPRGLDSLYDDKWVPEYEGP